MRVWMLFQTRLKYVSIARSFFLSGQKKIKKILKEIMSQLEPYTDFEIYTIQPQDKRKVNG